MKWRRKKAVKKAVAGLGMEKETSISLRIDKQTKEEFKRTVEEMGLDMTSAIKLYIKKVIREKRIPFEVEG